MDQVSLFQHSAMLEYIAFVSCLEFAVLNSLCCDTILKPKQVVCLESIFLKRMLCVFFQLVTENP